MATKRVKVVVIGAGAAGIVAARHLAKAGVELTVLERGRRVGGLWSHQNHPENPLYDSLRTNLPSSIMGLSESSFSTQHATFMPHAEVGSFLQQYAASKGVIDRVRFGHTVVSVEPVPKSSWQPTQVYDSDGSSSTELWPRYRVTARAEDTSAAAPSPVATASDGELASASSTSSSPGGSTATFDADFVVVCNGHFESPLVPPLAGAEHLRGGFMHSLLYRRPSQLRGRRVMVVGSGPSGSDVAVELLKACPAVWLSTRDCSDGVEAADVSEAERCGLGGVPSEGKAWPDPALVALRPGAQEQGGKGGDDECGHVGVGGRLFRCGPPSRVHEDGRVETASGALVSVDTVVWCTGYRYRFGGSLADLSGAHGAMGSGAGEGEDGDIRSGGFLSPCGVRVEEDGKRVRSLFMGLFQSDAPSLAVVGVPWRVNPFPLFETQARVVAAVASGMAVLPAGAAREEEEELYWRYVREGLGLPPRFAHMVGGLQWEYSRTLLDMADGRGREAEARWKALLRKAVGGDESDGHTSHSSSSSSSEQAYDWSLVDGPRSEVVSSSPIDYASDSGAKAEDAATPASPHEPSKPSLGIPRIQPLLDIDACAEAAGAGPVSTWGGAMRERLARDRAMYLNVSDARAIDAVGYRKREYRFRVAREGGVDEAEPLVRAEPSRSHGTGLLEVHKEFVVAVPPEEHDDDDGSSSVSSVKDTSSRLMATPF